MAFNSIKDFYRAWSSLPLLQDPVVDMAIKCLRSNSQQRLGFFGAARPDALATAVRILQDHGQATTVEDQFKIVEALKQLDVQQQLRSRVLIQLAVTALILLPTLGIILGWVQASDDLQKASYGLVGTVVGYWLK